MRDRLVIVQARMSSRRLPGKVLMQIAGKTVLQHLIESLLAHFTRDDLIVATSNKACDDLISEQCKSLGIASIRGPLDNVALRFLKALEENPTKWFARVNADSPLFDGYQVIRAFQLAAQSGADLVTSVGQGYPSGMNVEVARSSFFASHYSSFSKPEHYEHVTKFFYERPETTKFALLVPTSAEFSRLKLSLDTEEDKVRLEKILDFLGDGASRLSFVEKCEKALAVLR